MYGLKAMARFIAVSLTLVVGLFASGCTQAQQAIPADDMSVAGTKQLAGRVRDPELGQTYDYETFNYTVVNGQKSREGYPIYAMECNFKGDRKCYGESGQLLGTIDEVAAEITTVSNRDVTRFDWECDRICVNSQNFVVGALTPQMRAWLERQSKVKR